MRLRVGGGGFFPKADDFVPIVSGLPALETWTVPDVAGTLNGDHPWVDFIGAHGWNVSGGAAQLQSGGTIAHGGRMVVDLGTSDYLVSLTVAEWFDTGVGLLTAGPCARFQGDTFTCYATTLTASAGVGSLNLFRFAAGTPTTLATMPITPVSGALLGLRVRGSAITALYQSIPLLTTIDGVIPTGRFVGLQGVANTGQRVRIDNLNAVAISSLARMRRATLTPLTGVR